jgi:hypothetical protein
MRYIDADKLIDKIFPIGLIDDGNYTINAKAVKIAIDKMPTADVVPKSEVEELEAECERQYEQAKADILANMADGGTSCHWCIDVHKAKAKSEVAREIFEEIERTFKALLMGDITDIEKILAVLKKKYTESEDTQ